MRGELFALTMSMLLAVAVPFPALAEGPGDLIGTNTSETSGESAAAGENADSRGTSDGADSTGTSAEDGKGSALPVVAVDPETIRPYMTVDASSVPGSDGILGTVPGVVYCGYDGAGTLISSGTTSDPAQMICNAGGFRHLMLQHLNVGRWYYRTYTAEKGWTNWYINGEMTPDQGLIQAVQIRVKGYTHTLGTVYYRAVLNDGTLTDWAGEGQGVGTIGGDRYIVALKIAFVKSGFAFTGETGRSMDNEHQEGFFIDGNGQPRYSTADGSAYTGWAFDGDSNQYYFQDGTACTGMQNIGGVNIYFNEKGVAQKDLEPVIGLQKSYKIRINKGSRAVYVYSQDASGNYNTVFKVFNCTPGPATPPGTYKIYEQYRWHLMHPGCYCQYLSRFYKGFMFHTFLYKEQDANSLRAKTYDFVDDNTSEGCIRLAAGDAAWIFAHCGKGTKVEIYDDAADKGPLEKDALIDVIPLNSGFDPTDPRL